MLRLPGQIARKIQRILKQARVARLATVDPKKRPHVVPVCFALVGKALYSAVDQKPKRVAPERLVRLQNIRAVSRVALLIDQYDEDWNQLWYVLIRGKANLLSNSSRQERGLAIRRLRAKYPQYTPQMLADNAAIIRIIPDRITSWGNI
ncbi:MAG: TIGR03668 family PPOX class F420-dependent oxidoreductase [Acidobacteria bacterium]|nr:TIGR03668 family PPOX class F420-dependent oxidoreductase [Acidobacteriota bacterium]